MDLETADVVVDDVAAASDVAEDTQEVATDVADESALTEEAQPEVQEDAEAEPAIAEDGRKIPLDLRKTLEALKTSNPKLAKELRNRWFAAEAIRAEVPGGIQEIRELTKTFKDIGGKEGLAQIQKDHAYYGGLDQKWLAGDPALVDNLATANPESFAKLGPKFLSKFSEVDAEGYQHSMAGVLARTFRDSGLESQLYLVKQNLAMGNAEEAKNLIGGIEQWLGDISKMASTPPKAKEAQPNDEVAKLKQQIQQREQQDFNTSVGQEFSSWRSAEIKKELIKQFPKAKDMNPQRYKVFENAVMSEINEKIGKDPKFKASFEQYVTARDKDGLLAFNKSKNAAFIPDTVKEQFKILFSEGMAKPKPTPTGAKPAVPGQKPVAGWVKISSRPKPELVARGHGETTTEMIMRGQAILKDGRRVTWDR